MTRSASLRRSLRYFGRNKMLVIGCIMLVVPVVCALAAQWLAPADPGAQTLIMRLKPPSWLGATRVSCSGRTAWGATSSRA